MRLRRSSSAWTTSGAARIAPAPSRGARRAVCGATAARPAARDIRCPHRHSAVRPALQGALAPLRRGLGRRGDDCRVCRALRDCAEYGSPLAPPLPEGASSSAGPPSRDRRGRRDLRAREPEGGADAGPQAAPARRQSPQTRPLARAGAGPGRRRPHRRDPQLHPADPQRQERDAGSGAGRRPRRLARLRRQQVLSACRGSARHPARDINRSAGERVRGAVHIQTVNSRHSQIKGFLRRFPGIATKYLDSYLRWFHLIELADRPPPRACLTAAMAKPCLRFAN